MIKYLNSKVTFAEVPTEVCLTFSISGCPHRCIGCNQPELWKDVGTPLFPSLAEEIAKNPNITCVCILGGDADHADVARCAAEVHRLGKKVAFYSGDDEIDRKLLKVLDYYKVGHWDELYGPLNNPTTNQKLYRLERGKLVDITSSFWYKENIWKK